MDYTARFESRCLEQRSNSEGVRPESAQDRKGGAEYYRWTDKDKKVDVTGITYWARRQLILFAPTADDKRRQAQR